MQQLSHVIGLVGLALFMSANHPMHVSHATLRISEQGGWTLEKTMFTEDLEHALQSFTDQPNLMLMKDSALDAQHISSYLRQHLIFTKISWRKSESLDFQMTSCMVKADEVKIQLDFPAAKKFRLMDTSLMETDPHQENLYTIKSEVGRMDVALWSHSTSFTYPEQD